MIKNTQLKTKSTVQLTVQPNVRSKSLALFAGLALVSLIAGCASQVNKDPLEGVNRGVYKFNDVTDKVVFKPVATAYKAITPTPVRKGVNNFFNNLGSITTV